MELTSEPTQNTASNIASHPALEEKFASRIGECFLGAVDRLAEHKGVSTDEIILNLFADNDQLSTLIGCVVEEFEELYFTMPKLWPPHSQGLESSS